MYQKVTLSKLEITPSSPSTPNDNINNINLSKTKLICDHCGKPIRRLGVIYIIPLKNIAVFFCSWKCKKFYKTYTVIRTCVQCGIQIPRIGNQRHCSETCRSKRLNKVLTCLVCNKLFIDKSSNIVSTKRFCSKTCANRKSATKYKEYYYCDMCYDWIRKADAKSMKTAIKTFKVCPKVSCNNNKLRTRAKRSKAKDNEEKKFYYE